MTMLYQRQIWGWAPALVVLLGACSLALDWREVRPEGADLLALFPCKPEVLSRPNMAPAPGASGAQSVSNASGVMGLAQCKSGGMSFSLSWAEVPDLPMVTPALTQMRASLTTKLAASGAEAQAVQIAGMTPNPAAMQQLMLSGSQAAQLAVFTRGRRVYQAVMLSPKPDAGTWQTFLDGVRLGS
ncbi:hypothetical protein [Roseateles koreensis]|uniref:Lipoprotein n=1 Tax=Roseateles koreensis TaxID=2987526 RepID=A0ABT5KVA9_9BURK|nr:hypothetical protein [Roseateles koreensis]MDC8786854.1 hypothetical protein [Roseateles koreensis]